jgi:hypothetical protein
VIVFDLPPMQHSFRVTATLGRMRRAGATQHERAIAPDGHLELAQRCPQELSVFVERLGSGMGGG